MPTDYFIFGYVLLPSNSSVIPFAFVRLEIMEENRD